LTPTSNSPFHFFRLWLSFSMILNATNRKKVWKCKWQESEGDRKNTECWPRQFTGRSMANIRKSEWIERPVPPHYSVADMYPVPSLSIGYQFSRAYPCVFGIIYWQLRFRLRRRKSHCLQPPEGSQPSVWDAEKPKKNARTSR
jgi:hypothetical protein